jgi:acetyl-CoA carboxylase carboxyl transferase subunit beta
MAFFRKKKEIPLGLWMKCPGCTKMAFTKTVEENLHVCPECDFHMKVSAPVRLSQLIDEGTWEPLGEDVKPVDTLHFVDSDSYESKLKKTQAKTGLTEAALAGTGKLEGHPVAACIMEFGFMGGSMGVVVGERVALAADAAHDRRMPFVLVATSGGARMQEGALSLMQMAKTSAAIARLRAERIPFISILTDPCTGGVSASFAAQGDLTLAEPGALIGFAGPRVIQSTIKTTLPDGFQRAEFLLEHGYVDRIVHRKKLKKEVASLIEYLWGGPAGADAEPANALAPGAQPAS